MSDDHPLDTRDAIILTLGGVTSTLASGFLILTFVVHKELRKQPGDLILGLCICELIVAIQWIIQAIGGFMDITVDEDGFWCQSNAFVSVGLGTAIYLYNMGFVVYFLFALRNALKSAISPAVFHGAIILFTLAMVIFMKITDSLGKTVLGTCSMKYSDTVLSALGPALIVGAFVFISIYTLRYIKAHSNSVYTESKKGFVKFYTSYVTATIIIYIIIALFYWLPFIMRLVGDHAWDDVFEALGTLAKVTCPLVLSILRYREPTFKNKVDKILSNKLKIRLLGNEDNIHLQDELPNTSDKVTNKDDLNASINKDGKSASEDAIFDISGEQKQILTFSAIASIRHYFWYLKQVGMSNTNVTAEQNLFHCQMNLDISQDVLIKSNTLKTGPNGQLPSFRNLKLKVYAPRIFENLVVQDSSEVFDFLKTLDLSSNSEAIKKAGQADGGAGGEFFFFSHDSRLILKSITETERLVMLKILPEFHEHLMLNHHSLIAKMYGLFEVKFEDLPPLRLCLLQNLNGGIKKNSVIATYDLKGSSIARQVIKDKEHKDLEINNEPLRDSEGGPSPSHRKRRITNKVLKDMDFLKFQQTLPFSAAKKQAYLRIVRQDADFFRDLDIMDYSLFITKIDLGLMTEAEKELIKSKHEFRLVPSAHPEEQNIVYNLGIIDYLQQYDWNKMLEKGFKMVKALDIEVDVSVQDPKKYAERFIEFSKKITTEPTISNNNNNRQERVQIYA